MEDRSPIVSAVSEQSGSVPAVGRRFAGRGAWVLTAYGVCGLALFGLLAYFFSEFIAR